MIVDVHAHLDMIEKDLDLVIKDAKAKGISTIISNSGNLSSCKKNIEIAKKYPMVKCALGLYPLDALKEDPVKTIEFINKNIKFACALGEIGLDYHLPKYSDEKSIKTQKNIFEEQLEIAKNKKLPVIVHSRKAELDVIETLESFNIKKIIIHCFGGKLKLTKRISDNNWYFSIPASVVRAEHFQNIVLNTNLSQILSETDSPFQSPFIGKDNEPAFIVEGIKKIAQLKKITVEECINSLYMNYQKTF